MKKLFLILLLSSPSLASGPKYSQKDPLLQDEIENIYKDIGNVLNGNVRISSVTVGTLVISTITVSSFTATSINTGALKINGASVTNACGYIIGTIVQTLKTADTSFTSSSGTSYTTTTTAATLTPKCSTDIVNIWVAGTLNSIAFSTSNSYLSIFQDTTDLEGTNNGFVLLSGNATNTVMQVPSSAIYSGSAVSTSARTYAVKIKSDVAGKATWNGNGTGSIIVQEVAN